MNRMVEVSERGTEIRLDGGRLRITPPDREAEFVPLCDIAALVLSERAVSLSAASLAELADAGILTVLCDKCHSPVAIVQPFDVKSDQTRVMQAQVDASLPIRKQLWRALVRRKLFNQAAVLDRCRSGGGELRRLAKCVRSGDTDNSEGVGARIYWRELGLFKSRDRLAPDANRLFNYAYMVLLSMTGQAVCATGLHPAFGLHHVNGRNAFCLASDLMEAFRIVADDAVLSWLATRPGTTEVTPAAKRFLVGRMMCARLESHDSSIDLSDALGVSARSLRESLLSGEFRLRLPRFTFEAKEVAACG